MKQDKFEILAFISRIVIIGILTFVQVESPAASLEYEIKAAFIYNFAKFVEWPAVPGSRQKETLTLCILGEDPFGEAIDKLDGRKVQEQTIKIERVGSIDDLTGCRILFISKSETDNLPELIKLLGSEKGILSISDIDGFAKNGGVIELVLHENKVKFTVNISTAKESQLNLSSKILRLANLVGDQGGND